MSRSMEKKKVFMVTYGGGHANIIKAVYNSLTAFRNVECTVLALTMAPEIFNNAGIPHITISQAVKNLNNYEEIKAYGTELAKEHHQDGKGILYDDSVAYLGSGYSDLVDLMGEEKAEAEFAEKGRKAFLPVRTMKSIFALEKPDVVVVTNSPRMEKASAIAANELNIPVVRINDLPYMSERMPYNANLCVMNEFTRKDIIAKGLAGNNSVFVTGQPVFEQDLILDKTLLEKYEAAVKSEYKHAVLYLGQIYSEESEIALNELYRISREMNDILFIIRPHPNDFTDYYEYKGNRNFIVSKEGLLKYLIKACDTVITHFSTGGLQAALLDRPLICLDVKGTNPINYAELGIAETIYEISRLETVLQDSLDKTSELSIRLKSARNDFRNKDSAAESICKVILDSIQKKSV